MRNKNKYISPAIKIVFMETTQPIAASNSGGLDTGGQGVKEHNSFWGSWDEEEDEEPVAQLKTKSLWD